MRTVKPLTSAEILAAKPGEKAYKLFDGGGLYLEVLTSGGKSWRMKYRMDGRENRITFGQFPEISWKMRVKKRDETKAGFTREQADAMAKANADAFNSMVATQQLATKQDIAQLQLTTQQEISVVRKEIADTRHEIIIWLFGMIVALGAFLTGYMSYFLK